MRKSRDETVNAVNLNANGLAIDATHLSTLSTYPALQRDGGHYGVPLMVFDASRSSVRIGSINSCGG